MPRFRPSIEQAAFYLYRRDPETGEIRGPCGTGVVIAMSSTVMGDKPHIYGVTAHHVVAAGASIIRFNRIERINHTKVGHIQIKVATVGSEYADFDPLEWQFIPGEDDIAAIDLTEVIGHQDHLVRGVPITDLADEDFLRDAMVTIGEDVFMIGLFTGNPGVQFNHIAARFGNISQLSYGRNPISQGNGVARPSHVIDMHSRPGFSGSPVFVYRTPTNDLNSIVDTGKFEKNRDRSEDSFLKLLGIHSAQFIERMDAEEPAESYGQPQPIRYGDKLAVQSSMTIVVPAWNIHTLLDLEHFVEIREMRESKSRKTLKPAVMPEAVQAEEQDRNPTHKADFMRLLSAAAITKPQGGQT